MKSRSIFVLAASVAAAKTPMSLRMLESIIARQQGLVSTGAATSTLESGILGIAMEAAITQYPESANTLSKYLARVIDTVAEDLLSADRDALKPLDRFSVATSIHDALALELFPVSDTAIKTYHAINQSLPLQNRNPEGGLWYYVYTDWSYLDGVFSLLPFMASLQTPNYTDMALQVSLLRDHCYHEESGLFVHGYDWSHRAAWADAQTGASSYVWGRSLAWFISGLVQTWERLGCMNETLAADKSSFCKTIQKMTTDTAENILRFADKETGAWWQVLTFPSCNGNFIESSSTALFIFALLKAERTGLLPSREASFREAALRAYNHAEYSFVRETGNDTIGFDRTVVVCSLNSTATYEYYTQRPVVQNGLLGEAAFVLASLEMERHSYERI